MGHRAALELAAHGTVVLVGRDPKKLADVQAEIRSRGGEAVPVVADFSDIASVRGAAAEIVALDLPIGGVLNNAGIMPVKPGTDAQGWDTAFTTNHLGPFAFTEALIPHLADGTNIVFIVSAVEDIDRKPAYRAGYRGGRYISAEASARGEWMPGVHRRTPTTPMPPRSRVASPRSSRLLASSRSSISALSSQESRRGRTSGATCRLPCS